MNPLERLARAALAIMKLEVDVSDVFPGDPRRDCILKNARKRRMKLWEEINRWGQRSIRNAKTDAKFSAIEQRVSDLVEACRHLYCAGSNNQWHKKPFAEINEEEESRKYDFIYNLSRKVEDAATRLQLLTELLRDDTPGAIPPPGFDTAWPLEMRANLADRKVCRKGRIVDFEGKATLWSVLLKLIKCHPNKCATSALEKATAGPDAVYATISNLRNHFLKRLGVSVENTRNVGYHLVEVDVEA